MFQRVSASFFFQDLVPGNNVGKSVERGHRPFCSLVMRTKNSFLLDSFFLAEGAPAACNRFFYFGGGGREAHA